MMQPIDLVVSHCIRYRPDLLPAANLQLRPLVELMSRTLAPFFLHRSGERSSCSA